MAETKKVPVFTPPISKGTNLTTKGATPAKTTTRTRKTVTMKAFQGAVEPITVSETKGETEEITPSILITPVLTTKEPTLSLQDLLTQIWGDFPDQIAILTALVYQGTKNPIITTDRRDILIEVVGMLVAQPFEEVIAFLEVVQRPNDILWNQESMDVGRRAVEREISVSMMGEVGIKGMGKCRFCQSTELVFSTIQIRSADEASDIKVRCVLCGNQWIKR
jgi:hypothetical protein